MDARLSVRELPFLDPGQSQVFRKAFRADPPNIPRHFLAELSGIGDTRPIAYVHYRVFEEGVYQCGGLCVDSPAYRVMAPGLRRELAAHGSLSRWVLRQSIEALGRKRAVFAYTGNVQSRRDTLALGFVPAGRYLLVQWHGEPAASQADLVARVARGGPF